MGYIICHFSRLSIIDMVNAETKDAVMQQIKGFLDDIIETQ